MNQLTNPTMRGLIEQAKIYIDSGFLPYSIKKPEQAVVIMMKGKELNIPPLEALNSIDVIQGKPTVSPKLMLSLAERTGELEDRKLTYKDDGTCVFEVKRKNKSWHKSEFGPKEANAMGLSGKDNYRKQAKTMFKWRAVADNLRFSFGDAISGLYLHEEMAPDERYDEEGVRIDEVKEIRNQHGDDIAEMAERGRQQKMKMLENLRNDPTAIAEMDDKVTADELRKRIRLALREMCGDDVDVLKDALKKYSSFGEGDNLFPGHDKTESLKGKHLKATYGKVKAAAKKYREDRDATTGTARNPVGEGKQEG